MQTVAPALVDGQMTLRQLRRYAAIYDAISSGSTYPAADFIEWLRAEIRLEGLRQSPSLPAGRPGPERSLVSP